MKHIQIYSLLLLVIVLQLPVAAQQTKKVYYGSSKQLYSIEHWNKQHTRCHFTLFYEDGKLMADGCKRKDRYRRLELPDSFFVARNAQGSVIQKMTMNKDSLLVITYDDSGTLRGRIWADKHHCHEEEYYVSGKLSVVHECSLPDSLSYFSSYFRYTRDEIRINKNLRWPQPLFPVNYGWAGNDGVSAPGTFKIYSNAFNIISGVFRGNCQTATYPQQ